MPHLEEQFPPVNPLVLLRPDALEPPDREEEENNRTENRAEDERPIPGSLADGIDRVTISANARVIAPVQPLEETDSSPLENRATPELLAIEIENRNLGAETPATDEITGAGLQDFVNGVEDNRASNNETFRVDRNPAEQVIAPAFAPAVPPVPTAERVTRDEPVSRIENRIATEPPPVANVEPERDEVAAPVNENRFIPLASPPRGPLPIEPDSPAVAEPAAGTPLENPLGLRGNTPEPLDRRVNILTPANVGEDPPGPNIDEARNFGQGRTLSLDPAATGNDRNVIAPNTVDEVLEEAGAIPGPDAPEPPEEIVPTPPDALPSPSVAPIPTNTAPPIVEIAVAPEENDFVPAVPDLRDSDTERRPVIERDPVASEGVTSFLLNTNEVLEASEAFEELQPPAFPELDLDEPFVPDVEPEAREEDVPAVAQAPLNAPLPAVEEAVPVAPPIPGNVETLNENPQALRRDNLGTDPALRSNRELRNFLQQFNDRIETPKAVTKSEGGPITEVQNNAPPPPAAFENLEALSAELLEQVREQEAPQGVTRPEEEPTAPPEPRTPESLLTGRGQNIDRFI
jgi:hypothetical protein